MSQVVDAIKQEHKGAIYLCGHSSGAACCLTTCLTKKKRSRRLLFYCT
nr:hypothetical protein P5627_07665 [Bacillus safensis]